MKTLLIDNEADTRAVIRGMIQAYCPEVSVVGEANSVHAGIKQIRLLKPDLVLLDIQLEDGTGFDLLDFFPNPDFKVVFIAAHDAFALKAFRYHAMDYLLKPISAAELSNALGRSRGQALSGQKLLMDPLKSGFIPKNLDRIAINNSDSITFLDIADILHLESEGSYTTFITEKRENLIASRGLNEFEDLLPIPDFYRIHQSHVVQLRHVRKFLKEDGGFVLMSNGDKIPVSRRKKEALLRLLLHR